MSEKVHEVTVWLQVQPRLRKKPSWQVGDDLQLYEVDGFSIVGVTKGRPTLRRGGVAMQLKVRLADEMFLPLIPQALLEVPIEKVLLGEPIEVDVETPIVQVPVLDQSDEEDQS